MLCYPAPYLQNLTAPLGDAIGQRDESSKNGLITPIFADHAPFLRILKLKGYIVHYHAPWLCQLHILHLDGEHNICALLAVLSATRSLREAQLMLEGHSNTTSPIPNAYLPRLEFLQLHTAHPHQGATILNHIEIPVNCILAVRTGYLRRSR